MKRPDWDFGSTQNGLCLSEHNPAPISQCIRQLCYLAPPRFVWPAKVRLTVPKGLNPVHTQLFKRPSCISWPLACAGTLPTGIWPGRNNGQCTSTLHTCTEYSATSRHHLPMLPLCIGQGRPHIKPSKAPYSHCHSFGIHSSPS